MLSQFFARITVALTVFFIVLVAAAIAAGYFAQAIYLLIASVVTPPAAAALTGVSVIVIAVLLVSLVRLGAPRRRSRESRAEAREDEPDLANDLARKLKTLGEAQSNGTLLATLIAGFAVGLSPKLRAFLESVLKL